MNAQMKSSIASENAQSPCFTYDHINHKIVGTELNFRKSGIPGSDQDTELMARLAEHPNYTFRIIKPDKEKNTYKGLTRELMYDYLEMSKQGLLLIEFQKMKLDGVGYPAIKSWFLDQFPGFNVSKAKREVQQYRLGVVKQKYKVVKALPKPATDNKPAIDLSALPMASGM